MPNQLSCTKYSLGGGVFLLFVPYPMHHSTCILLSRLLRWLLLLLKSMRRGTLQLLKNLVLSVRCWMISGPGLGEPTSNSRQVRPILPLSPLDSGTETFCAMADPGPSNVHADVSMSHTGVDPGMPHAQFRSHSGDHLMPYSPSPRRSSRMIGSQPSLQDEPDPITQITTHQFRPPSISIAQESGSSPHSAHVQFTASALGPPRSRTPSQKSISQQSRISQASTGRTSERERHGLPPPYRRFPKSESPHYRALAGQGLRESVLLSPGGHVHVTLTAPPSPDDPTQPGELLAGHRFYPMSANDVLRYDRHNLM